MNRNPPEDDLAPDAFEHRLIEHFAAHRSEPTDVAQRTWGRLVPWLDLPKSTSLQGVYQMKDHHTDARESLRVSAIPEYATPALPQGARSLVRFAVPGVVVLVVIIGLVFTLKMVTPLGKTVTTPGSAASTQPVLPTRVTLEAHFGTTTVTTSHVAVPVGTTVTLSVIPDHALAPFHNLTMGIYAQDPAPFSELAYCTYPNTVTCRYVPVYSSSERTDYTKGTHTFVAFLGSIAGNINQTSNAITITWT